MYYSAKDTWFGLCLRQQLEECISGRETETTHPPKQICRGWAHQPPTLMTSRVQDCYEWMVRSSECWVYVKMLVYFTKKSGVRCVSGKVVCPF